MNNLQIGDNDLYGHRFNGHDLHLYLNKKQICSKHLVWNKYSNDENTYKMFSNFSERESLSRLLSSIENDFGTQSFFSPFNFELFSNPFFLEADVVHYHLVHNFPFNLFFLPLLSKLKASVWTIHDPWIATGRCVYPLDCNLWKNGCGVCPDLTTPFSMEKDNSALNWQIKKMIFDQCDIDLIVASSYMKNLLLESPLLHNKNIHLIPFGLDLSLFKPEPHKNNNIRQMYNIKEDEIVIAFRGTLSAFKGFDFVKKALKLLNVDKKICLLSVGETNLLKEFENQYKIVELGWVFDDNQMISIYNAADIFLMPSEREAFGMMAMEAMACAKPIIVFQGTALPETVAAPDCGIAVDMGDVKALVQNLEELIMNPRKRAQIADNALNYARKVYNKDRYVNDVIKVYEEAIHRRQEDSKMVFLLENLKGNVLKSVNVGEKLNDQLKTNDVEVLRKLIKYILKNKLLKFFFMKMIVPMGRFMFKLLKRK